MEGAFRFLEYYRITVLYIPQHGLDAWLLGRNGVGKEAEKILLFHTLFLCRLGMKSPCLYLKYKYKNRKHKNRNTNVLPVPTSGKQVRSSIIRVWSWKLECRRLYLEYDSTVYVPT